MHASSSLTSRSTQIVKHLQAIKRVSYDQDIELDTRINRMKETQEEQAYFDVSFGRKNSFTIVLGQFFFEHIFPLLSFHFWFQWPAKKVSLVEFSVV